MLQECTALEEKGLLLVDTALYIIIPLVSGGNSGQLAVWEMIHSTIDNRAQSLLSMIQQTNSTKSIPRTLTHWSRSTPHSTLTSPGGASIESVASVTGVDGHSVLTQW